MDEKRAGVDACGVHGRGVLTIHRRCALTLQLSGRISVSPRD